MTTNDIEKPVALEADKAAGTNALWVQLLLVIFVSLMVFVAMRGIEKVFFDKEIIAVDLKVVLSKELEKSGTQIMTEEQRNQRASAFNQALEVALDKVSNNGHKIILVSPAVISGVTDYTQVVTDEVTRTLDESFKQRGFQK
ncbi:MAG TPA: TrbI F-type domain-containing protein [Agitococcus sp.]|nr:TrbI F-type domain-containing protein [Agitococcus sp.]HNH43752.1 TrbI F-type domain-containing protein [Agitococcus sp.]